MAVAVSETLTASVTQQSDVSDGMFELLTGLLLRDKNLPLRLAEKLFERRGVTAAELVAFVAREDLPSETLLDWVRKERRVTVGVYISGLFRDVSLERSRRPQPPRCPGAGYVCRDGCVDCAFPDCCTHASLIDCDRPGAVRPWSGGA